MTKELAPTRPASLSQLSVARRALAEADTLPEIAELIDRAEVVRVAARKAELSRDAQNDWAEYKLDAERKAGGLLVEMKARGEYGRGIKSRTVRDFGIEDTAAARWQQLAELPAESLEAYKAEQRAGGGEITEAGALRLARQTARRADRAERAAALAEAPDMAALGPFGVLYVDPPWRYEHAVSDSRAVENQYPTMELGDLKALSSDVPAADDAVLFCWATSPKLAEAMDLLAAWKFDYRTCMVWVKDKIGMGYYARQQHELLLIAKRGEPPTPEPEDRPASVITAPRPAQHSAKPVEFYEAIERMYPDLPRVELFARTRRLGWATWGNEAGP
jgi:N6-adenosine-specific RNA methylase IME4